MKWLSRLAAVGLLVLPGTLSAEIIYLTGDNGVLVTIDSSAPGVPLSTRAITGMQPAEAIRGIDFRPADGKLYAVGSTSRLYRINTSTGVATPVSSNAFSPGLTGPSYGFDFNPTVDRIRVVSQTGQNLRLHPDTGAVVVADTNLAFAITDINYQRTPGIVGAAYTNSTPQASTTTLYGIDSTQDVLVRLGSLNGSPTSPNTGLVYTIGTLGYNATLETQFDISSVTGTAFAVIREGAQNDLYTIDLSIGAATKVGTIGGLSTVSGMALAQDVLYYTIPVAGTAEGLNGTSFRTDLTLSNYSAFETTAKLEFFRNSASANAGAASTVNVTLAAGEQNVYDDVVQELFGTSGYGAIRVTTSRPISMVANIYNDQSATGEGTYGQFARALDETERRTAGNIPAIQHQSADTHAGSRTNVGWFNPGASTVTLTLSLRDENGSVLSTAIKTVPAYAQQQTSVSELFGVTGVSNGYITFTTNGSGLFVYASVVDNVSGSALFIPSFRN